MSDQDALERAWAIISAPASDLVELHDALRAIPDDAAPGLELYGECDDCGGRLQTGIERSERLCYTCVRERTGR